MDLAEVPPGSITVHSVRLLGLTLSFTNSAEAGLACRGQFSSVTLFPLVCFVFGECLWVFECHGDVRVCVRSFCVQFEIN